MMKTWTRSSQLSSSSKTKPTTRSLLQFSPNRNKKRESSNNQKENESANDKSRDKEKDKTTAPNTDQESRPRTSRWKRSGKNRRKSGTSSGGGNSALGFHSNLQNHPLLQNIDNLKTQHNRSVNVTTNSPRAKKKKISKGRVSPNTLAINHQRHPSAAIDGINPPK